MMGREHWVLDKIDNIVYSVPTGVTEYKGNKKYYSTGSIQKDFHTEEGVFSFNEKPSRANRIARINDVFQARMKNTNKPIIVDDSNEGALFSTGFMQLRPFGNTYLEKLLYYYVQSSDFIKQKDDLATGSTQEALTDSNAVNLEFPLPPLNEQKRIVEKLDAILPKVKSAKVRLEKIPAILKKFRQSVIATACSGRLTEDWREGKDLPEWVETTIGQQIKDLCYGTSKKCDYDVKNGTPVLRIPNVSTGKLDLLDLKYALIENKEFSKLKLKKGDLLLVRSNGSVNLLGQSVLIDESAVDFIFAGYLIRLRCKDELSPYFLNLTLKTNSLREQIEIPARSTTGVNNINSDEIKSLQIPLPPLEEQQEIVRRVEKLFTLADSLEAKYKKAIARVEKIEQSILAKAFRGELVEPDPNDEPAEELLKRILEEKAKLVGEKKSRKRKGGIK